MHKISFSILWLLLSRNRTVLPIWMNRPSFLWNCLEFFFVSLYSFFFTLTRKMHRIKMCLKVLKNHETSLTQKKYIQKLCEGSDKSSMSVNAERYLNGIGYTKIESYTLRTSTKINVQPKAAKTHLHTETFGCAKFRTSIEFCVRLRFCATYFVEMCLKEASQEIIKRNVFSFPSVRTFMCTI